MRAPGASARPSARHRTARSESVARCHARASSTVRLPSRMSSPEGLPVSSGSPKTPRWSSRSWNAMPHGVRMLSMAAMRVSSPPPQ